MLRNVGARVAADLEVCIERYARMSPSKLSGVKRGRQYGETTTKKPVLDTNDVLLFGDH
jgi:hypothetical protein